MENLKIVFPEKTERELLTVSKRFYRNFTDNFIETIKLLSMSPKQIRKRFVADFSLLDEIFASGQTVQISLGHFFNWELGNAAFGLDNPFKQLVVYMPISNRIMDRLFMYMRRRFGTSLIAATRFTREIVPYLRKQHCLILVADQSAGSSDQSYWLPFFGKMTPFVTGPEKGARVANAAVVFGTIKKWKRGHYTAHLSLVTTTPRELAEGDITRQLAGFIEKAIRDHPEIYLWSHRRWKKSFDAERHAHLVI